MHALPRSAHEHHDQLLPHVHEIDDLGRAVGSAPRDEISARLALVHTFLVHQLVPHMEAAEGTLYPELERLMQNRHSMTPMRREHGELRALFAELGGLTSTYATAQAGPSDDRRLRRVLFRMYALLMIHLSEEEAFVKVLDHNLAPEEQERLVRGMEHELLETTEVG